MNPPRQGTVEAIEEFLGRVARARRELALLVFTFPGQHEATLPAPRHLRQQSEAGRPLPPFIREASDDEVIDWLHAHRPDLLG